MLDDPTEFPIYTEMLGLVSAEVYQYDGVYALFLVGDQVACFLAHISHMAKKSQSNS